MALDQLDRPTGSVGAPFSGLYNRRPPQSPWTSQAAFPRAIEQQASDYDDIMRRYRGLSDTPNPEYAGLMERYRQALNQQQAGPAQGRYEETPEFREAFGNAREMMRTGGLSDADQANLRARGISPIRAMYANAQRNMERQARLGGGRSANYNAALSRMAREQSESTAGAMTNVNAGIAEMIQRGRLTAMPEMTRMGEGSSGRRNEMEMGNAELRARHGENVRSTLSGMAELMGSDQARRAEALRGMTSLYGTTPALVNTFGNQVQQQNELRENQNQFRAGQRTRNANFMGANRFGMGRY